MRATACRAERKPLAEAVVFTFWFMSGVAGCAASDGEPQEHDGGASPMVRPDAGLRDAGDRGNADATSPVRIDDDGDALKWGEVTLDDAVSIDGDSFGECHVSTEGKVLCRGDADHGQLGNGTLGGVNGAPFSTDTFGEVSGLSDASDVISLDVHSRCALRDEGSVVCWGKLDGTVGFTLEPLAVGPPTGAGSARMIRATEFGLRELFALTDTDQVCLIATDGSGSCRPVVDGAKTFAVTRDAAYVIDGTGSVYACSLSAPAAECTNIPVQAPAVDIVANVATNGSRTVQALLEDGRVACWGECPLGDASTLTVVDEGSPRLIPGLDAVARFVSARCTADTDDTIRCWGSSIHRGPYSFYTAPDRIGVLAGLARIVGAEFGGVPNAGLTTDGQVRAIVWP